MEKEMKKITIGILVVLAALCLCSCAATKEAIESKYPRIYTIDASSRDAVLTNAIKSVSAESVAALGGIGELDKAVRSQIPEGFLKITLINEKRCSMMVTLSSSTNVLEGRIENDTLIFEVGETKDVYQFSTDKQRLMGNWYGVTVVLVYDET
jgi:hypothetical protein